jgi:heat shock protein HslJ
VRAERASLAILAGALALACRSPVLEGSEWNAEQIDGQPVLADARPTLSFQEGDRAGGSAGCNRWFASVELSGEKLRFGRAGATRMACEPARMQQESRFLSALEAVRSWRLEGGTLLLLDESRTERVRLSRTGKSGL